jgi:tetratricopeptide (TPR) repeat protein
VKRPEGRAPHALRLRGWATRFAALLIFFAALFSTRAADSPTAFDQANRLYEQGKFSEAVSAYEAFALTNPPTASVWFNLGNAAYKSGQLGRAIAAYRLAERLTPRDAALRANLQFVREKIYSDERTRVPLAKSLVRLATLNEWTVLTVAVFWAMCFVLATGEWTRRRYFKTAAALFALTLLAGAGLLASLRDQRSGEAIVVAREVTARFGPLDESQAAFQLRDGAEAQVLDAKGVWLQVRDAEQRIGWVRLGEVIVLPQW